MVGDMFIIRPLKSELDYLQASNLIDSVNYYGDVPPTILQGTTMYGMFTSDDDGMFGCAMAIVQGPQAYVDYLTIHPLMQNEGFATKLTAYVQSALYAKGVREIHACVRGENGASLAVCSQLRPLIGFPYSKLTFKYELEENHGVE